MNSIMKKILLAACLLITASTFAQNTNLQWLKGLQNSTGDEIVQSIAVNANGDVLVGGSFTGTVNFNPTGGTPVNLVSAGNADAFYAKYSNDGALIWAKRLGSTDNDEIYALVTNAAGEVYVAGYFEGSVDFDPDPTSTATLSSSGDTDIFYGYFDVDGGLVWVNKHGSTGSDAAKAIDIDVDENVYVTGYFNATVDFDPSTAVQNITSVGGEDIFFAKYTNDGDLVWSKSIGSITDDHANTLDLDADGNVYIGGVFSGSADFDTSTAQANLSIVGGIDGFFARFDDLGALVWANRLGSSTDDGVTSMAVSSDGSVYAGGYFSGALDFDNSTTVQSRTPKGLDDIFLVKYDGTVGTGQFKSVITLGNSGYDGCDLLILTPEGNIYMGGYFSGTVDFDPSPTAFSLTSRGDYSGYFVGFDQAGNFIQATSAGDEVAAVAVDDSANIYIGGWFSLTSQFSTTISITSLGGYDAFFGKYSQSAPLANEPTAQPTSLTFTNVTETGFDFSFSAPSVSPDGFIGIIKIGSSPLNPPVDGQTYVAHDPDPTAEVVFFTGASTSYTFDTATPGTSYYLDIFSYNGTDAQTNYRITNPLEGSVTTPSGDDTTDPVITHTPLASVQAGNAIVINADFTDPESGIDVAEIHYATTEVAADYSNFEIADMVKGSGNTYSFTIPSSKVKGLGVTYYLRAENGAGAGTDTDDYTARIEVTGDGLQIPFAGYGTEQSNFRIVSFPLEMKNPSVSSVLADDLGAQDDSKWRIFHYLGGTSQALSSSAPLQTGRGYWLIVRKSDKNILTGPGKMPNVSISNPFVINLVSGWNQIGNPYNFDVSWQAILDYNGNPTEIAANLKNYKGAWGNSPKLEKFSGGFVMANDNFQLKIPPYKDPTINGRKATEKLTLPIDNSMWEVDLKIQNGSLSFDLAGIGMHPEASEGVDRFDDFNLPHFMEFVELNHTKKFMDFGYSRDIVPTSDSHVWEFSIDSNSEEETIQLTWDNSYFGLSDRQLVLWDVARNFPIDMRATNNYTFRRKESKVFKVLFGNQTYVKANTKVKSLLFQQASPNPSAGPVLFSFSVPESSISQQVTLEVFDLLGKKISTVFNAQADPGFHEAEWNGLNDVLQRPAAGVYLTILRSGNQTDMGRIILK
jgi:hypothetical protein